MQDGVQTLDRIIACQLLVGCARLSLQSTKSCRSWTRLTVAVTPAQFPTIKPIYTVRGGVWPKSHKQKQHDSVPGDPFDNYR